MRRIAWVAAAAATVAVGIGGGRVIGADGQDDERGRSKACSEATVAGDYGFRLKAQTRAWRPDRGGHRYRLSHLRRRGEFQPGLKPEGFDYRNQP